MENYLVDTHSHIDLEEFETDLDLVIQKALDFNVKKIVVPSVDRNSFEKVIKIAQENEGVFAALGIHPTEADKVDDSDFAMVESLVLKQKVIAIGECGLDYYWDKSFVEKQKEVFLKQIEIAKKYKLPLIVHDREAHKDTFDLLNDNIANEIPVVMHCFSGSVEFANECVKKGFYIGIGGVVTFKNAKKMHEVVKEIPLESILLETDAPYLTPVPYRGKRNEPAYIKFVADEIASIKGVSYDEVATITTENARKVFGF